MASRKKPVFSFLLLLPHIISSKNWCPFLTDIPVSFSISLLWFVASKDPSEFSDTVPPAPSLLVEAPVDSCNNGGILLPNRTCGCPPYTLGDNCNQVVCRHYGIQDQSRCACPPGSYALNCEPSREI